MKKNIMQLAFVLSIFLVLLLSMVRTVFFPKEINYYENRKAEMLAPVTLQSYLDGTLQDNMEKALADQAFLAQRIKKTYNSALSAYMHTASGELARANPDRYIKIGGHYLYGGDHLMNSKRAVETVQEKLSQRIEEHNRLFARHPEVDFYLYYVENDMDVHFETGERSGTYEYIAAKTALPQSHIDRFGIDSYEEFDRYFYKTDHHWNAEGSYRAYKEVVELLLPKDEAVLQPIEKVVVSTDFGGSKTMGKETANFKEPFEAYRFAFPQATVWGNNMPAPGYGNQEAFLDGTAALPLTYATFYGDDWGAVTFDTYRPEKENLLIISESYDNAILRLLAGHFNRTISIDLRNFNAYLGTDFSIEECIEQYDIDKVLLLGYVDYFIMDEFGLEK